MWNAQLTIVTSSSYVQTKNTIKLLEKLNPCLLLFGNKSSPDAAKAEIKSCFYFSLLHPAEHRPKAFNAEKNYWVANKKLFVFIHKLDAECSTSWEVRVEKTGYTMLHYERNLKGENQRNVLICERKIKCLWKLNLLKIRFSQWNHFWKWNLFNACWWWAAFKSTFDVFSVRKIYGSNLCELQFSSVLLRLCRAKKNERNCSIRCLKYSREIELKSLSLAHNFLWLWSEFLLAKIYLQKKLARDGCLAMSSI